MLLRVGTRELHCFTGRAKCVLESCFGLGELGSQEAASAGRHRWPALRNVSSNLALRCVALLALVPLVHAGPAINSTGRFSRSTIHRNGHNELLTHVALNLGCEACTVTFLSS